MKRYKKHFGLMFTNLAAVLIMIASLLRLMQTSIASLFYQDWFRNYENQYELFSLLSAVGSLFGGPIATLITGMFVDAFAHRSEMIIPMICIIKSLVEAPFSFMVFGQLGNFYVAMAGIYGEYFLSKGWTSSAMLILTNVVDP